MVRNPRTLMMCGLLALATGLALGSRLAPTAVAPLPTAMPGLVERLAGRGHTAWAPPAARVDALASEAIVVDDAGAVDATTTGLEGDRLPRMPRMSRETMARPAR